jgi:predicted AlkP superfamily phosphohydrolase/phosphomutase
MEPVMPGKLLVIGLDGFNLEIFQAARRACKFDFLRGFLDDAAWGEAHIDLNQRGWAIGLTGKDASHHNGYYYQMSPVDYSIYEKFDARDFYEDCLWRRVSLLEKRVGVVGLPSTSPPLPVNGFMVASGAAGFFPKDLGQLVYPPDLLASAAEAFSDCIVDVRPDFYGDPLKMLHDLKAMDISRVKLALALKEKYDVDLLVVGFVGFDRIGHTFWDDELVFANRRRGDLDRAIMEYIEGVDECLRELVETCPDWDVVIFSDHGMVKRNYTLYINSLLCQLGFARPSQSLKVSLVEYLRQKVTQGMTPKMRHALKTFLRKQKMVGAGTVISSPSLDWDHTMAFGYFMHGVYVNRRGLYARGIVENDQYEMLRSKIIEALKNYHNPVNGKPIFHEVRRREEVLSGPFSAAAPDILFRLPDGIDVRGELNATALVPFVSEMSRTNEMPPVHKGIHSSRAFFAVRRPGQNHGSVVSNLPLNRVYDLMMSTFETN